MFFFLPFSCTRVCVCGCMADLHTITICMNIILIILHFIALTFRLNALACIIIMIMGLWPLIHEFEWKMLRLFFVVNFKLVGVCEHA